MSLGIHRQNGGGAGRTDANRPWLRVRYRRRPKPAHTTIAAEVHARPFPKRPPTEMLKMAICRRGKPDALLHHSDQVSQFSSEQFQKLRANHGVTRSMS